MQRKRGRQHTQLALANSAKGSHPKPNPPYLPPNDIRDMLRSLPNNRAAGKHGIPSQILKDLPYRHITKVATLFEQLANDIDYRSNHRPQIWQEAIVTMLPKEAGATQLTKYRPISLVTQLQEVYTHRLLSQCSHIIDSQISETQSGYRRTRQAAPLHHSTSH